MGPASADTAEVYLGSAAARALNVSASLPASAAGPAQTIQLTLGGATAKAASDQTASATGTGQALPIAVNPTEASVSVPKNNVRSASDGPSCGQVLAPAQVPVTLNLACGSANASADGLPNAHGEGSVAGLTVDADTALSALDAVTTPIGNTLFGALDTVCTTLKDLDKTGTTCAATTTVKDLVTSVLKTRTLDGSIGKATADVVTDAKSITSTATANASTIKILPLPQVNGLPSTEPVVTIDVSKASAKAVYDRAAGKTLTPTADAAIVHVKVNTALTNALAPLFPAGANPTDFEVVPGQHVKILDGTPLQSEIFVYSTQIVTNPDGTQGAIADGVKLHLLEGIGESKAGAYDGGITLELSHAEAGVAGAPASVTTPTTSTQDLPRSDNPEIARELPRTGGNPFLPIAGAVVLTVAVLVRRATVRMAAKGTDS